MTSFAVAADHYDRYVGRYGDLLARALLDAGGLTRGSFGAGLDVGCGTGALTRVLAERATDRVAAVDPSVPFVEALRSRLPDVDVHLATAEALPFADDTFDVACAQLVVNFMADPVRGLAEMRRVVRPSGTIAAAVWDYAGEMTLLRVFWECAAACAPDRAALADERTTMSFARGGELETFFREAGLLGEVRGGALVGEAEYESFDDLWEPLEHGVGPAGAFMTSLSADEREALRRDFRVRLGVPAGSFTLAARAWYAVGTVEA